MTIMNKSFRQAKAALALILCGLSSAALADECQLAKRVEPVNLTVPVTVQIPPSVTVAPTGTVLYKKEASLTQLTGSHRPITGACRETIRKVLNGRITTSQDGLNTFATSLSGLGLRITVIYDKPGTAHQEWVLPFSTPITGLSSAGLTTDDFKLRFEAVKTGEIESGTLNFSLPSLLALNDNSLIVSLAVRVLSAKAHCSILVPNPQINLPPIDAAELAGGGTKTPFPVNLRLSCLNTRKASLSIEGLNESYRPSIFKNMSSDNPAGGVGIEMLYSGSVMSPNNPIDLSLPQKQGAISLPLTVRYAKTNEKITQGKVKAQITLRINYL